MNTLTLLRLAPEVLIKLKFSEKSDVKTIEIFLCFSRIGFQVWSFGVVLYEIFSYGEEPYEKKTNQETINFVKNEGTLASRPDWPEVIRNLMAQCFIWNTEQRISFKDIETQLFLSTRVRYSKQ